jgi:hypothetical protein
MGSADLEVQGADRSQLAEVESPPCDRIVFALCVRETGLRTCLPEKSGRRHPLPQSSPFSPVRFITQESRNTGMFAHFGAMSGGSSLQFRLRGGARGIRTFGPLSRR